MEYKWRFKIIIYVKISGNIFFIIYVMQFLKTRCKINGFLTQQFYLFSWKIKSFFFFVENIINFSTYSYNGEIFAFLKKAKVLNDFKCYFLLGILSILVLGEKKLLNVPQVYEAEKPIWTSYEIFHLSSN